MRGRGTTDTADKISVNCLSKSAMSWMNIVAEVAQAHGWDVRVTDGSKGGARFDITGIEFIDE
jgi:hypothetical protein